MALEFFKKIIRSRPRNFPLAQEVTKALAVETLPSQTSRDVFFNVTNGHIAGQEAKWQEIISGDNAQELRGHLAVLIAESPLQSAEVYRFFHKCGVDINYAPGGDLKKASICKAIIEYTSLRSIHKISDIALVVNTSIELSDIHSPAVAAALTHLLSSDIRHTNHRDFNTNYGCDIAEASYAFGRSLLDKGAALDREQFRLAVKKKDFNPPLNLGYGLALYALQTKRTINLDQETLNHCFISACPNHWISEYNLIDRYSPGLDLPRIIPTAADLALAIAGHDLFQGRVDGINPTTRQQENISAIEYFSRHAKIFFETKPDKYTISYRIINTLLERFPLNNHDVIRVVDCAEDPKTKAYLASRFNTADNTYNALKELGL